jgi:uncharacterized Zn finger protein (UPF0148 family)
VYVYNLFYYCVLKHNGVSIEKKKGEVICAVCNRVVMPVVDVCKHKVDWNLK